MELSQDFIHSVADKIDDEITDCISVGRGEHNENFSLQGKKQKYLLRIFANKQFENAQNEFEILSQVPEGIAPKPLYLDTSKELIKFDWMLQEFVENSPIEVSDASIKECILLLKRLHKKKGPAKTYSFFSDKRREGFNGHQNLRILYDKIKAQYKEIESFLVNYQRNSLVHIDPVMENFRKTSVGLVLFDWEFAGFDYFFKDLAIFIAENHLDDNQQLIVETYGWGSNPEEAKILHVFKEERILSLIEWLLHRLDAIEQGNTVAEWQDKEQYTKKLEEETDYLQSLINLWSTLP